MTEYQKPLLVESYITTYFILIANIDSRIKLNVLIFISFISTTFLILYSDRLTLAENHSGAYTYNIFGSNDEPLIQILNLFVDYEKFLGLMMTFCAFSIFPIFSLFKLPESFAIP